MHILPLSSDAEKQPTSDEKKEIDYIHVTPATHGPTVDFFFVPIPRRLQYHSDNPFEFGIMMNLAFSFAVTFIISNLYYCQPLLIQMAETFNVSYEEVSKIPTLLQAGYAVGILFISPLGDLLRRRQLFLLLVFLTATLTIGLATVPSLLGFEIISFLLGVANVSAQILVPLAADLAPPERRGFAYSIVLTGMISGVLFARVISGIVAEFTSWRVVYYLAVGAQYLILLVGYFIIPDYPEKNKDITYRQILTSMVKYALTEPLMIQMEIISIATSACFSSYWVTMTFLLGGPPYNYSVLVIGLFGLVGLAGISIGPIIGKYIDSIAPWHGILVGTVLLLIFQGVQTAAGGINVIAVVIACIGIDAVRQVQNVSMVTYIFSIDMNAASRLNALFVLAFYIGQLTGSSVGTKVFVESGWRAASALAMALYAFQVAVLLIRGPHCDRKTWFGYQGGLDLFRSGRK